MITNYVAKKGGIGEDTVGNLMVEPIEVRFGSVDRPSANKQRFCNEGSADVAYETQSFSRMVRLEV